jgi:hypothetical protein
MQSVDRLAIFERLKCSVQLLACPPEIQLEMLPNFVCKADQLALDFDLWREVVLSNFRSELSTDQMSCIENIDRSLSQLTRVGPECWTEESLRKSEEWKRVRTLAAAALDSFGWPLETPQSHADEFIGGL